MTTRWRLKKHKWVYRPSSFGLFDWWLIVFVRSMRNGSLLYCLNIVCTVCVCACVCLCVCVWVGCCQKAVRSSFTESSNLFVSIKVCYHYLCVGVCVFCVCVCVCVCFCACMRFLLLTINIRKQGCIIHLEVNLTVSVQASKSFEDVPLIKSW